MKIVLLTGSGDSGNILYHAISQYFDIDKVIIENGVSKKKLLKGRIKKLGMFYVLNQLIFQVLIMPFLKIYSKKRVGQLLVTLGLNIKPFPEMKTIRVNSVNSQNCKLLLKEINADIILVAGTRIISKKILDATDALFINTHVGITPQYRGVYGAYWALVNNDEENCGVTIHSVDKGIDTGAIIGQRTIEVSKKDSFFTYKYLQYSKAIELLLEALEQFNRDGKVNLYKKTDVASKLHYHPRSTTYLYNLLKNSVR